MEEKKLVMMGMRRANQIRRLVGRRMDAVPARKRAMRRLYGVNLKRKDFEVLGGIYCLIDVEVRKTTGPSILAPSFTSTGFCGLASFESDNMLEANSQGQKFNATMVIVISREFEKVLVEQNHCHGLKTVIKSYLWSDGVHNREEGHVQRPKQYHFQSHRSSVTASRYNSHLLLQKLLERYLEEPTKPLPGTGGNMQRAPSTYLQHSTQLQTTQDVETSEAGVAIPVATFSSGTSSGG